MPTVLQLRRGTTAEHSSFTGALGEVTVNTTKDTLVVHDGSTAGGFELALASGSNLSGASGLDTDDVSEGSSNVYYTDARSRAAVSVTDSGGDGSLAYNSSTGVITYTGSSASEVRAHFSAGTGITISSGTIATTITQYADSDVESYLSGGTGVTFSSGVISIGQAVGTASNVQFNNVQVDGTLTSDDITSTNISASGNLTVTGNLTVSGTTTTVNSETLTIDDNIIVLNNNESGTPSQNAGIEVERGTSTNVALRWNETDDKWQVTEDGSTYYDIVTENDSGSTFLANVSEDTTPQLGGDLDVNGNAIVSTSNGNIAITPNGTGLVRLDGNVDIQSGEIVLKNSGSVSNIKFYCESSNAHYTQLQSAAHSAYSGNVTLTMPTSTDTLVGRATTDTLTNKTLTSPDINTPDIDGGTIDNTVIGGTTAAAGSFTTISASSTITAGGDVTVTGHVLPGADVTYDLGSSGAKWRDLYLSGSSIELGGASISASGSGLALDSLVLTNDMTVGNNTSITAAGSDQSGATALSKTFNVVTTATANQGVKLPTASAGVTYTVKNDTSVNIKIYPNTSGTINGGSANAAIDCPAGSTTRLIGASSTDWDTLVDIVVYDSSGTRLN